MLYLVVDANNILYRTFHAMIREYPNEDVSGIAHHTALTTLNKYYKQFNPDKIMMVFDRPNWRVLYTKSDECVSKQIYKGDRHQNLTTKQQKQLQEFRKHVADFENIIHEHTSIICLSAKLLEADDLIAGIVQRYADKHKIVIISGDKDLIQLIQPNVKLYDPHTGNERTLEPWNNDTKLFLFEKYIRGGDDNVMSAFPRVRKTRIWKAYTDGYERANLMNTSWTHPTTQRTFIVKDVFEENKLLMGLHEQPDFIRELINTTITEAVNNPGSFSYFHFMRYLGKYELKRIADGIDNYVYMLS